MKYLINRLGTEYREVELVYEAEKLIKTGEWNYTTKSQFMKFKLKHSKPSVYTIIREVFKNGLPFSNRKLRAMRGPKRRVNNRKGSKGARKLKQVIVFNGTSRTLKRSV